MQKKGEVIRNILVICLVVIGFSFLGGCTQQEQEQEQEQEQDLEHQPGLVNGVVKTDTGYISGLQQDELRVFLGIPFAAPPTGELRWKPPAPVQPWEGVLETKQFSPACPQPPAAAGQGISPEMSEDCLYLNVWTPAKSVDGKLPVMLFFYGGAFGKIAGSMPLYNGTALAEQGVIVVTTNYRVGALGFLAHPQLTDESSDNSSGNYGLLDQIAAMEWVQENIEAFGGDPSRVTIFGQSAGGESVLIHLITPQSRGLYQQAIVQSGTLWTHGPIIDSVSTKAEAEQYGETYAQNLGYSGPDAISQMRELSYQEIVNTTPWPESPFEMMNSRHFEPTIDGWLIPDSPDKLFSLHHQNPVPLIIGYNADDGITTAADANMTVLEYRTYIQDRFGNDADAVLAQYPASSAEEVQVQLDQIMTDYEFKDVAKFVAGSMAEVNENTYLYRYSYVLPGQPYGAFHGSEAFLLFKVPTIESDPAVGDNLIDLWTRFAKTGDPNGGMNVIWPQYTRDGGQYLDIGDIPTVKSDA